MKAKSPALAGFTKRSGRSRWATSSRLRMACPAFARPADRPTRGSAAGLVTCASAGAAASAAASASGSGRANDRGVMARIPCCMGKGAPAGRRAIDGPSAWGLDRGEQGLHARDLGALVGVHVGGEAEGFGLLRGAG